MEHRSLVLGFLVAAAACGGRFASDQGVDGSGGQPGGGTGGSVGTGGGVAGGWTGAGGAGTAGAAGGQGGSDWGACQPTDTCVLEPVNACGPGCEPVALSAFIAVNDASLEEYLRSRPQPPCAAPMCPSLPAGQANMPNYMGRCIAGRCQPIDVRTSELSQCKVSTDCYVRGGLGCCQGCGDLVALSYVGGVEKALCPGGAVPCPMIKCAPLPYMPIANCSATGHCALQYLVAVDAGIAYPL